MAMQGTVGKSVYSIFASLLEYPREDMAGMAGECLKALEGHPHYPGEVVEEVKKFQKAVSEVPLDDLQGIYSYTFEIASGEFTMDLGYHLHDGFNRANSLVSLKAMYREQGFPFDSVGKGELPDFLPVVLRFLDFVKDEKLKSDFRESFIIKALEKLQKNFDLNPSKESPYRHIIKAACVAMAADIKADAAAEKQRGYSA
ncbi:MAG: hypothetical protein HY890_07450 [Deltaproteobacteria bacterium]|nr:hypothetical protein [Deltaproteobacteria bacterium]